LAQTVSVAIAPIIVQGGGGVAQLLFRAGYNSGKRP